MAAVPLVNDGPLFRLDAEKVLTAFGKYGRYQMITYFLTNSVMIFYATSTMIMAYIAQTPPFTCNVMVHDDHQTIQMNHSASFRSINQCSVYDQLSNRTIKCGGSGSDFHNNNYTTGFVFNETTKYSTLSSEFNLVCANGNWAHLGSSIFMAGGIIIRPFISQWSDRYGRRWPFMISLWLATISNLACSFAPNYMIFLCFRFLAGAGTAGFTVVGWVLSCESVCIEFRSLIPLVNWFTWVSGYMLVGIVHEFIPNWRLLNFVLSAPAIVTISYYWYTPESLHWLITHRKTNAIKEYIDASSRTNRMTIKLENCLTKNSHHRLDRDESIIHRRSIVDVFTSPPLVFHLLLHSFVMIVMNLCYWGLSLFSTDLSDDNFTGYMLSGAIELPSGLVAIPLLQIMGRRTLSFVALIGQSITMTFIGTLHGTKWLDLLFSLMAKCFNCIVWTSEPLMITEMTPTSIRNVFYGTIDMLADLGAVFAPYINLLKLIDSRLPALLLAVLSVLAAICILVSPETAKKSLPQDIDQFDAGPVWRIFCGRSKRRYTIR